MDGDMWDDEDDWDDDGTDDDEEQGAIPFGMSALSLNGVFWDYNKWSDEVVDKVVDYKVKFGIFPNALIACEDTLDTLCEVSEAWEDVDDDDEQTDEKVAARIREDFKECKSFNVDDIIEFGLPQLFLGNKIISPLYKLRLLCDETMESGIYRLSWIQNLPEDTEGEEDLGLDSLDDDDDEDDEGETPPDNITLDDFDTDDEELGDEDDEDVDDETKRKRAWAKVTRSFKEIIKQEEQLSEEEKRANFLFMKKGLLAIVTHQMRYWGQENPPKFERGQDVPIEIASADERQPTLDVLGFGGKDVAEFFEGANPQIDEFLCKIICLIEPVSLAPSMCEVRGQAVHFVFPIEKGKMRKILKGGHAQELHDNCQKVGDAFKERFDWTGDVEFDFPEEQP